MIYHYYHDSSFLRTIFPKRENTDFHSTRIYRVLWGNLFQCYTGTLSNHKQIYSYLFEKFLLILHRVINQKIPKFAFFTIFTNFSKFFESWRTCHPLNHQAGAWLMFTVSNSRFRSALARYWSLYVGYGSVCLPQSLNFEQLIDPHIRRWVHAYRVATTLQNSDLHFHEESINLIFGPGVRSWQPIFLPTRD